MLLARCLRDLGDPAAAFARLHDLRRDRVAEIVRQSQQTSSRKAPGRVGAWLRDRALPAFIRLGTSAQHAQYAYRIDWNGA